MTESSECQRRWSCHDIWNFVCCQNNQKLKHFVDYLYEEEITDFDGTKSDIDQGKIVNNNNDNDNTNDTDSDKDNDDNKDHDNDDNHDKNSIGDSNSSSGGDTNTNNIIKSNQVMSNCCLNDNTDNCKNGNSDDSTSSIGKTDFTDNKRDNRCEAINDGCSAYNNNNYNNNNNNNNNDIICRMNVNN